MARSEGVLQLDKDIIKSINRVDLVFDRLAIQEIFVPESKVLVYQTGGNVIAVNEG